MLIAPDDIEWDDSNSGHATRHGVTVDEITQALLNHPRVHRNRKGRTGDLYVVGETDGGRQITVVVARDIDRRVVRPISAWEQPVTDDVKQLTEAELADHYYVQRKDPDALGEQVDYRPPRGARVGVRLTFDEERRIRAAADMAGMTVSAYLRQAGLSAAAARVVDIDRLRRDVDEARARIDAAWRALA